MELNLCLECIAAITTAKEIISCDLIPTQISAGTGPDTYIHCGASYAPDSG